MTLAKTSMAWLLAAGLAGCTTVRSGADAWIGQDVATLEKHALLRTLPMIRTINTDGLEQRAYQSRANAPQCYAEGNVTPGALLSLASYTQAMACTGRSSSGCDFVFTLRDGKVASYAAGGLMFDARSCAAAGAAGKG